jgi:hypothetical protein
VPDPDDTLNRIDAMVEAWERRPDAMVWRGDTVADIDPSGLPLAPEPPALTGQGWSDVGHVDGDTAPDRPGLQVRRGPARVLFAPGSDECGMCRRRYCDGRDQCQAPTALIHGLRHYVPSGRKPVAYMYQFIDTLTTEADQHPYARTFMTPVSWTRHRLARYLTEDPRYPDGALLVDFTEEAGRADGAQGTVVLVIAHIPEGDRLPAPERNSISLEDLAAPYRITSPVLRPTFFHEPPGGEHR